MYSTTNNQTTKRIYNLIDELQAKLLKNKKNKRNLNRTDFGNNNDLLSNDIIILRNQNPTKSNDNFRYININPDQSKSLGNNVLNNNNNIPSDNDIRKIIKEEFNILISSFQNEVNNNINNLDNKINNISNEHFNMKNDLNNLKNINKDDIMKNNKYNLDTENSLNEIKQLVKGFVPYKDFEQKNKEIFDKIALIQNNINIESKKIDDISTKLNNETNNINQKIKELNISFEELKNKFDNFYNNYNNEINVIKQNNNKILANETK